MLLLFSLLCVWISQVECVQLATQGPYVRVYDTRGEHVDWYENDHTVVAGPGGFYIVGITHTNPVNGMEENLDLAWSSNATGPYQRQSFSLGKRSPETQLWAPHVVPYGDGRWYMFYCGCGVDETNYHIRWAVSWDLRRWWCSTWDHSMEICGPCITAPLRPTRHAM